MDRRFLLVATMVPSTPRGRFCRGFAWRVAGENYTQRNFSYLRLGSQGSVATLNARPQEGVRLDDTPTSGPEDAGSSHAFTLATMSDLAIEEDNQGQWPEAQKLLEEGLELQRRAHGEDHPDTLKFMSLLARADGKLGRRAEAAK